VGFDFKRTTATATAGGGLASLNAYNGATRAAIFEFNSDSATDSGRFDFWVKPTGGGLTQAMTLKSTGNLLIGTTTDIAGTGGLHVAGTSTASTTTSGALRVGSNIGLSGNAGGASYFGGSLNLNNGGVTFQADGTTIAGNMAMWFRQASPSSSNYGIIGSSSFTGINAASGGIVALRIANGTVLEVNGGTNVVNVGATYKVNFADTTSASSSTVGALTIGNGTAATNVAIGAGNVNAGGTVTVAGTVIHTLSATPASASAAGTVGTMSWDANYIYICTATNTWKRVAIATW
jgi:hypothetical protein